MTLQRPHPPLCRQDHRHRLALDHRVQRHIAWRGRFLDHRSPRAELRLRPIFLAQLAQILLELCALPRRALDQRGEVGPLLVELPPLGLDFHFLQPPQAAQPHVENRLGLPVVQPEFGDHHRLGFILGADDLYHPVEVEIGNQITVKQFDPVVDLAQPVRRAPDEHFDLMRQPVGQHAFQTHHPRRPVRAQYVEIKRNFHFQLAQPEQAFHQDVRVDRPAARLDDDTDKLIAFVADISENRQLLVIDQRRQRLDQLALLHAVRNFGNDRDPRPASQILDRPFRPDPKRSPPRRISLRNRRRRIDDQPAGRQVRPAHKMEQRPVLGVGLIDQMDCRIDHFGGVVRRNVRRHADRNPARAIGKQIGEQPRHNLGFFVFPVVGGPIIDRTVVESGHQVDGNRRQPRFGIAIGRGIIAVDIAEIALPVDQWIAQRKCLGEADHRVINRLVAMRMIFADNIANNTCAFLISARRVKLEQTHRPEQTSVNRLQPIAQIGQRPCRDRRHRINQIPVGQGAVERGIDDMVERVGKVGGHCCRLAAKIRTGEGAKTGNGRTAEATIRPS